MERIWTKHKKINPVRSKTPLASADTLAHRTSNGVNTTLKPKVFVAMSGGVDSSVAAALLKKQGFDMVGVFFKSWQPRQNFWTSAYGAKIQKSKNLGGQAANCLWKTDRQDAMRVCAKLGIPFKTWDFSKEYEKEVVRYMVDSYRMGITPNPDIMCNKEIKFGLFLKKALAEGADYIATGHYARLRREIRNSKHEIRNKPKKQNSKNRKPETVNWKLLKGTDKNKDQSYFLWTLTQKQLKHCLFPIGDYMKPEVRKLAKKFGLPNYKKKDSQGVCFIGQFNMKEFLKSYIKPKRGEIRLVDGNIILGWHDGVYYYTIGQRHGLDIKDGGGPYYVAGKDLKKNILYVANKVNSKQLLANSAKIKELNWVNGKPKLPIETGIKIRYRSESVPANASRFNLETGEYLIKFKKPVRALTLGQSAVFYRGCQVLGGGIIASEWNDSDTLSDKCM